MSDQPVKPAGDDILTTYVSPAVQYDLFNVSVNAVRAISVPEPGAFTLFGIGFATVGFMRSMTEQKP
jgi:hypothetical protein